MRMLSPLRDFLHAEASGGILLLLATVAALVWRNSPWGHTYTEFWGSHASVTIAGHSLDLSLQHWMNDGLMTLFFLIVGLEIKREVTDGHLAGRRAATLPAIAALAGMAVPAAIYLAIAGGTEPRGWGVPMATDIALAVGVLAVLGPRVPASLRAFLLGLAIVDDIGAIVVIAVFYSDGVGLAWLAGAAGMLIAAVAMRAAGVHQSAPYWLVGVACWYMTYRAGVHPTLAGVAMGLLAPVTPWRAAELVDRDDLGDLGSVAAARESTALARSTVSVVEWLQYALHPWTSYVIVPLFALANAGVEVSADGLGEALRSPIAWGIIAGLAVGKPLGIWLASRISIRAGVADAPAGTTNRLLVGVGSAAGIGFTVALFVAELAFDDPARLDQAKLAILVASVLSGVAAVVILAARRRPAQPPLTGGNTATSSVSTIG